MTKPVIGIAGSVIIDSGGMFPDIAAAMLMKIMLIQSSKTVVFRTLFRLLRMMT